MPIMAKSKGDFELAPSGTHRAVCYALYDLGTHVETGGKYPGKSARKVRICWELTDELMKDGRPFTVGEKYTLSLSDKATLTKVLNSWRGKPFTDEERLGFDVSKLAGIPCLVTIIHNVSGDSTYANIATVTTLPKVMEKPKQVNPSVVFSLDDNGPIPPSVPQWIADIIMESPEWLSRGPGSARPVGSGGDARQPGSDDDHFDESLAPF